MLFYVGFPWNSDQIESDCVNLHLFPSEIVIWKHPHRVSILKRAVLNQMKYLPLEWAFEVFFFLFEKKKLYSIFI